MSTHYFIGPIDPLSYTDNSSESKPVCDLQIDPVDYRQKLMERWPSATEWESPGFAGEVRWDLDEYNLHGVEVSLNTDLQHVGFSSGGINFLEFIMWHRLYVSENFKLYLYNDSSFPEHLVLDSGISEDKVIDFCHLTDTGLIKESPLNGTWDGFLTTTSSGSKIKHPCVLHLFEYKEYLEGECSITHIDLSGGISIKLLGNINSYEDQFTLARENEINIYGESLGPIVENFDRLILKYSADKDPSLIGTSETSHDGVNVVIGNVKLNLRPQGSPPPAFLFAG
jgi:hypothetical protein